MIPPRNPDNEQERLASVHATGLLDTAVEERFDRITRLAQRLFNVPIALITMVDSNRQWFKSCIGLAVDETSREASFCGHAILGDDLFVINDSHADERFHDNPLVIGEPYIRFYAGYPIHIGKGLKMGTLCIIDRIPRDFGPEDRAALTDLGQMVESELVNLDLAIKDDLTQLLNRRGFSLLFKNNQSLMRRSEFKSTLAFIDLNGFKAINDTLGHKAGDEVLVNFSSLLAGSIRSSDLAARLGGDEFVVLFNNSGKDEAVAAMANFQALIDDYNAERHDALGVSFSFGLCPVDYREGLNLDDLLSRADQAMYQQKNRVRPTAAP